MRRIVTARRCLLAALASAAAGCQHFPTEFPFAVTDDCTVQRVAGVHGRDVHAAHAPTVTQEPLRVASAATVIAQTRSAAGTRGTAPERGGVSMPESRPVPSRPDRPFGFGFGFGFGIGAPTAAPQPDIGQQLAESGPHFPAAFTMSCVPVHGFVRGGWPVVVDYQPARSSSSVVLEIHTPDRPVHAVALDSSPRRHLVQVDVPQGLGDAPQVALFLLRANRQDGSAGGMQIYGLGAGPRAVGSVAIDQVNFRPGEIRVSRKQQASYSFFSRTDFSRTQVEILRVQRQGDEIRVNLARSAPLDVVIHRGMWVGKEQPLTWNGLDGDERVSSGAHLLQVRAWFNAQNEHDWVAAWSPDMVRVAE